MRQIFLLQSPRSLLQSLEHTAYLGRSVSEIALHKAGIIKEEVPVITGFYLMKL